MFIIGQQARKYKHMSHQEKRETHVPYVPLQERYNLYLEIWVYVLFLRLSQHSLYSSEKKTDTHNVSPIISKLSVLICSSLNRTSIAFLVILKKHLIDRI